MKTMKNDINENDVCVEYTTTNIGIEMLALKYHVGKKKINDILKRNNIHHKKRGAQKSKEVFKVSDWKIEKYPQVDGKHYIVYDEKTDFSSTDINNNSGTLTSYIEKAYGIETPTLYDRRMYYMRNGNYWWEQWLQIKLVENKETKKCPYCNWETIDVENKSGMFEQHLLKRHNMSKLDYLNEHPEDRDFFRLVNKKLDRQMEQDPSKFIICEICGEKLARIDNHHLKKHGITKKEYIKRYGDADLTSEDYHNRQSVASRIVNMNIERMRKRRTTSEFIELARQVHGDKYDYSKTEYTLGSNKVIITCPIHGDFEQKASHHLSGQGCNKCQIENRKNDVDELLERFNRIHNGQYQYKIEGRPTVKTKITIICPIHGEFTQSVGHHLSGEGCPKCKSSKISKKSKRTKEEFVELANNTHNMCYDYSNVDYVDCKTNITIICPKHGSFQQTPDAHLRGQGCPKCSNNVSRSEDEICQILSEVNPIQRDRAVLDGKEIDIFIPCKNIGIEYNGLRWHTEFFGGRDRYYHNNKLNDCLKRDVRLIQIFEDEYINHKDIVVSKLKHILGLETDKKSIYARKCSIKEITNKDAEFFLTKHHIQGFVSSTLYLGAFYNNELIGVMSFLKEKERNWNLTRFATNIQYNCVGIGGKLFKYFIRHYDFVEIKSFADRRWTTNVNDNVYTKLGFEFNGFTKPSYTYYNPIVDKFTRFHKFGFRKEILHRKYGLPKTMTETEMVRELGYDRIWDCGLIKYVYKN